MVPQPDFQNRSQCCRDPLYIGVLSRPIGESGHSLSRIVQPDAGADQQACCRRDRPSTPARRKPTARLTTPDLLTDVHRELRRDALGIHGAFQAGPELRASTELRGTGGAVLDVPLKLVM